MYGHQFTLSDARLTALASGALWWSSEGLLCVSDLHFGKSARRARQTGQMLPPYENQDTLSRLEQDILKLNPQTVICLGDSFDDMQALDEMEDSDHLWLTCLMAGRRWIWIEGNHDPGPVGLGGTHKLEHVHAGLVFRHIADASAAGEVSGHYHPKARISGKGRTVTRRCFLADERRLILPAYGTYTGGLRSDSAVLQELMDPRAIAVLCGQKAQAVPMRAVL